LADWIGCHVGLLAFLGGVPATIVCDNLKSGVTRVDRYEPHVNRMYQDLARHYGTAVLPARPYKPRDNRRCCWASAGSWPGCATSASSAWSS
jgi:transposase